MRLLLCILLLALAGLPLSAQEPQAMPNPVLGTYGHPQAFWDAGGHLGDYGINAVFIHSGSLDANTVARARAEGAKVFAEFATLNGKQGAYVEQHPEAHPIDDTGSPARPATWFMGVCPTHPGFREYRMAELRELLDRVQLDGVWMDYLHWHAQFEDPYPQFIKTCFNDSCVGAFESSAKVKVEGATAAEKAQWIFMNAAKAWEDWRVSVVVDWAREIHGIVKAKQPNALVGNYQVAWKDEDLGGVRRRCLGLDFEALAPHVDVYSPMIYHGRSGKSPDYVREYVAYFSEKHGVSIEPGTYPKLWPIVQAHDDPRIEPDEFEAVLRHGLIAKSTGVMMFTIGSVAADAGKMAVMKQVYTEATTN
ncbi:MAG: hypothetical protein HYV27_23930 [Candidatus Hydrogenedentes bacterium]|nr:hypothetical protein [Candidatus Hydrogenedentota bacterium]